MKRLIGYDIHHDKKPCRKIRNAVSPCGNLLIQPSELKTKKNDKAPARFEMNCTGA